MARPQAPLTSLLPLPGCCPPPQLQIQLDNHASADLTNCAVEKNWGQAGGAIDMSSGNGLTLTGVSFDSNRAGSVGGAIAVQVRFMEAAYEAPATSQEPPLVFKILPAAWIISSCFVDPTLGCSS